MSGQSFHSRSLRDALKMARMDLDRRLALEGRRPNALRYLGLMFMRGGLGVVLFRVVDWAHERNFRLIVKLGHLALFYLARAEIHPGANIGPGLVLPDIGGVGLPAFCDIGRNCTFTGPALLTIGGMEGVDLGTDRIVLGDDCIIGSNVRIIGAVTLGNGTQVKPSSVVMTSFAKDGYLVSGIPARRRAVFPVERIRRWSPLRAEFTQEQEGKA